MSYFKERASIHRQPTISPAIFTIFWCISHNKTATSDYLHYYFFIFRAHYSATFDFVFGFFLRGDILILFRFIYWMMCS